MNQTFIMVEPPIVENYYISINPEMVTIDAQFDVEEARIIRDWLNSILPTASEKP